MIRPPKSNGLPSSFNTGVGRHFGSIGSPSLKIATSPLPSVPLRPNSSNFV